MRWGRGRTNKWGGGVGIKTLETETNSRPFVPYFLAR